jgi:hypothetical protein
MLPLKPMIFTADFGLKPFMRSSPSAEIETVVPLSIAKLTSSVNRNGFASTNDLNASKLKHRSPRLTLQRRDP